MAAAPFVPPAAAVTRTAKRPCTESAVSGRLLAVNPQLDRGGSAGIVALLPGGRREILAWIRNYDPDYKAIYWLRRPLVLPAGSRLKVETAGGCAIDLTFAR